MTTTSDIVAKLWNLCHTLRDDGVTYHQYVTELTYLLFLKMAKETKTEGQIPKGWRWGDLVGKDGVEQLTFYRDLLNHLGAKAGGRVQAIYANANTSLRQPKNLAKLVGSIDELDWYQSGVDQAKAIYDKKMTPANIAAIHASKSADEAARILGEIQRKYDEACAAMQTLRDARANGVECPNLNQPGSDCGVFFVKTNPEPPTGTEKGRRKIGFDDGDARRICQKWRAAGYSWSTGSEIIHKTPLRGRRMP